MPLAIAALPAGAPEDDAGDGPTPSSRPARPPDGDDDGAAGRIDHGAAGGWASSRVPSRPCAFAVMSRHKEAARRRLGPGAALLDLSIGSSDLRPHARVLGALRDAPLGDPQTHSYSLRAATVPFLEAGAAWFAREFGGEAHARTAAAAAARAGAGAGAAAAAAAAAPPPRPSPPPPALRPLDPHREALALIGAQEGLAHLLLAVCEPGDRVLMCDVSYPPYASACDVASAVPRLYRLAPGGGCCGGGGGGGIDGGGGAVGPLLPALDEIEADLAAEEEEGEAAAGGGRGPRVLLVNLPHNPTGAVPSYAFWRRALDLCERRGLLLVSDNPYAALVFPRAGGKGDADEDANEGDDKDAAAARPSPEAARAMGFSEGEDPSSLPDTLTAPGALAYALYEGRGRESRVVELFSLSKSHLMGGMRLGLALGSSEAVAALEAVKAPIDFNPWRGLLRAGEVALRLPAGASTWRAAREYGRRAGALSRALAREAGWDVRGGPAGGSAGGGDGGGGGGCAPVAAMYVWARLPRGWSAARRRRRRSQDAGGGGKPSDEKDDAETGGERGGDGDGKTRDGDGDDDDDAAFCRDLVVATGVAVAPGSGFGPGGRGHVRWALVAPVPALEAAAKAVGAFFRGEV